MSGDFGYVDSDRLCSLRFLLFPIHLVTSGPEQNQGSLFELHSNAEQICAGHKASTVSSTE